MSLTNPKNVITEERLAEFYQTILPYLGGMPDILANKFSKSDLYSTDEKIIGQWIDGKPIYQCTYDLNGMSVGTNYTDIGVSCADIDTLICGGSFVTQVKSGNNPSQSCPVTLLGYSGSHIVAGIGGGSSRNVKYITIRYTKTTDSPVSIGNDTDYSTTEKIVGTWIDGKPIYQKTIQDTIPTSNDGWISISHNIANIDSCVDIKMGIIDTTSGSYSIIGGVYGSSSNNKFFGQFGKSSIAAYIIPNSTYKGMTLQATIQYTKTSD